MKKKLLPIAALLFSFIAQAQVPAGYYDSAYNGAVPKTCAALKTALFGIASRDTSYVAYNSPDGSYDTQDGVNNIDVHRNDANTANIIWDMYTDNPAGPELYTFSVGTDQCGSSFPPQVGACYNREHAFPRSWFGDDAHVRGDLHNVYATDGESNARHANFPYAEVGTASWTSDAGAKLGVCSFPGYNGTVFEVIDEYKGDFARVMFFMVTAYENFMPAWKSLSSADAVLDGTTWPSLDPWVIKQWYKWHIQDPVSAKEITRNDSVFRIQGNRNPFIDHPEFVALIWQCTGLLPVTVTDFSAVRNEDKVLLQWHVSMETSFKQYEVESSVDGVSFKGIGTVPAQNKPVYQLTDADLPNAGIIYYRLKMVDIDGRYTYSKTVTMKLNSRSRGISMYPNPGAGNITLALQQALPVSTVVKVMDIAGKELLRQTMPAGQNKLRLATDKLPAGRYVVSVLNYETIWYDSFVIIK